MTAVTPGIGPYLQELRMAKRITTADLAQMSNLRRATVSDWQGGKRIPRLPELETVLTALNATEAQRKRAYSLVKAPRAVQKLRSQAGKSSEEFVELAGHLPHGGDLLRALRMRNGWTQAQTAAAIDVQQTSIARWERSEIWPSPERLHALCYALHARPEEIGALTTGRFSLADDVRPPTEEEIFQNLLRMVTEPNPPEKTALNELTLLTLAAQAWPLALEKPAARYVLAEVYKVYADRLYLQRRFSECEKIALRSLDLYTNSGRIMTDCVRAALRAAAAMSQVGGRQTWKNALEILQIWLPHAQDIAYRSWMLSDLGKLHARLGNFAEAISLAQQGCQLVRGFHNAGDRVFRQHDLAEVLVYTGAPRKAEECLVPHHYHPHILLSHAHVHAALKDVPTVQHLLDLIAKTAPDPFMGILEHPYYAGEAAKIADSLVH